MKTSEIKHPKEAADQERSAEASEEKNRHQADRGQYYEGVSFNPPIGGEEGLEWSVRALSKSARILNFFKGLISGFYRFLDIGGRVCRRKKECFKLRGGKIDPFF
jgi:hypothetical protein